jgi:hypothetical protein
MFVDNLYCVRILANINGCKRSVQRTGVISNLLYFNSGDALLQHFEHSSLLGRILHHCVNGLQCFKSQASQDDCLTLMMKVLPFFKTWGSIHPVSHPRRL